MPLIIGLITLGPVYSVFANANYGFENRDDISTEGKEISPDTVTLGAAVRLAF